MRRPKGDRFDKLALKLCEVHEISYAGDSACPSCRRIAAALRRVAIKEYKHGFDAGSFWLNMGKPKE